MTIKTALAFLVASSAVAGLTGCGGSNSSSEPTGTTRASLHRAKSCGDLLTDLKADATFKVNHSIDRQIQSIQKCIEVSGDANCAYGGWGYAQGGAVNDGALGAPEAAPSAGSSSSSGGSGAAKDTGSRASSYSETNVQVKGVDEADIVKTDGANLYVIHGSTLKVVKAWPANELAELTSTQIEGSPSEMFVANGKAVVYSTVNGAAIFTAAGVQPKPQYSEYGYPAPGGVTRTGGVAAEDAAPYPGGGSSGPYYPLTKITVLDMGGAAPSVTREIYFEGGYLDSRRVGDQVRTVLQNPAHGPKLIGSVYELYAPKATDPSSSTSSSSGGTADPWGGTTTTDPYPKTGTQAIQALQQLKAENKKIIDASQLGDWIPYTFIKEGAAIRAQTVACEDFYVPTVGSTEAGMTEVVSIDLGKPGQPPRETAILGHAETVYGSADTLYLAASAWVETPFAWSGGGTGGGDVAVAPPSTGGSSGAEPAPAPIGTQSLKPRTTPPSTVTAWPTNKTHVHKFEFATDPGFPNYVASGTVAGSVKNQFSMDDKDGNLRIATTENRLYIDGSGNYVSPDFGDPKTTTVVNPNTVNRLFVMKVNGAWLDVIGDAGALAPNEQIYSARFVGNRGYVVTFRRVDPLFVFDLTMPTNPQKLAELTIPGFSEYMHPLGETHLLTIGRDATSTGRATGLQLKIFDVTNGAMPKVAQEFTYSSSTYGSSEAEYDHKAFTYFAEKKLLAFPYYSYSNTDGSMRSSLEIFKVDPATGFQMLGSIDHTSLVSSAPTGYYCGYYGPQVRRGVFLEDFVYSISYGGIVVKNTANMTDPGTSLSLPQPTVNTGYGPVCDSAGGGI